MFAVFVILLAMGLFSSFISSITAAVNSLRSVRMAQVQQETKIRQFFNERNLSAELFNKVQDVCKKRGLYEIRLKEDEVGILQELPEAMRRRLHEEIFLPYLHATPFVPQWSHSVEHRFLRKVCHVAMRERSVLSSQDVFHMGTPSLDVIFPQYGSLGYFAMMQDSSRVADSVDFESRDRRTVGLGDIICMPCLFAVWNHRGRLTADAGTCYYAVLKTDIFSTLIMQQPGPLQQYLQIYAMLLVSVMEAQQDEGQEVTDMCLPIPILEGVSRRSQRFMDIMNEKVQNIAMQEASTGGARIFHDFGLANGPLRVTHYSQNSGQRKDEAYHSEETEFDAFQFG